MNIMQSYVLGRMPNPKSDRRQWQVEDGAGRLIDDNNGRGFTIDEADRAAAMHYKRLGTE